MKKLFIICITIFFSCIPKNSNQNIPIKEIKIIYNKGIYSYHLIEGKLTIKNYENITYQNFKINKNFKMNITNLYYDEKLNEKPKEIEIVVDDDTYLNMPATEIDYYILFENGNTQHFYLQKDNEKTPLDYYKYKGYKKFILEIDKVIISLKKTYNFNKSDIIRI